MDQAHRQIMPEQTLQPVPFREAKCRNDLADDLLVKRGVWGCQLTRCQWQHRKGDMELNCARDVHTWEKNHMTDIERQSQHSHKNGASLFGENTWGYTHTHTHWLMVIDKVKSGINNLMLHVRDSASCFYFSPYETIILHISSIW